MKRKIFILSLLQIVILSWCMSSAYAGDVRGVTDTEIKLACLVDFSGPGKFAGKPLALGAETFVKYINDQGDIHGRKINLIVEDNGIMPNTTLAAARKVIFKDEVFAIGFNLGSAGSSAIIPLIEQNKVVMMPHGANRKFYNPGNKWVFVPYATQYNMASRAVEFIIRERDAKARIGIIYQDDGFGREGLEGAQAAAEFLGVELVAEAPYKIGTVDLSPQMRKMKDANVDYILAWTYVPQTGSVMKIKAQMNWDVQVVGNNTTAYRLIFPILGELADGYMAVTPYVPWEDVPESTKDILKKYGVYDIVAKSPFPAPMFFGAWDYFAAMAEGLRLAGRDLTPEGLVKGLEQVEDLDTGSGAPKMSFGPDKHAAYYGSLIVKAFAKEQRFEVISPLKEPVTPQD